MLVACFTEIPNPDQRQADESNQCISITIDEMDNSLCIESMEMPFHWNIKRMCGPFPPMSAYSYLHNMKRNMQSPFASNRVVCAFLCWKCQLKIESFYFLKEHIVVGI